MVFIGREYTPGFRERAPLTYVAICKDVWEESAIERSGVFMFCYLEWYFNILIFVQAPSMTSPGLITPQPPPMQQHQGG